MKYLIIAYILLEDFMSTEIPPSASEVAVANAI